MLFAFQHVITDVIKSVYQPFFFALIQAALVLYLYLFCYKPDAAGKGLKAAVSSWLTCFKRDRQFRTLFYFVFYTVLILFRTLYSREMWVNPLQNVIGVWGFHKQSTSGEVLYTTEILENLALFIPFSILLLIRFKDRIAKTGKLRDLLTHTTGLVFLFSLCIEILQLFLRVGTFQLSDLFYNSLGGLIGAFAYWLFMGICHKSGLHNGQKEL